MIKQDSKVQQWYENGLDYYYGRNGRKTDFSKSAKFFLKAAKVGHAEAASYLSLQYFNGLYFPIDKKESEKWVDISVKLGSRMSRYYQYLDKNGDLSEGEVFSLVKQEAENNDVRGWCALGYCYALGVGVELSEELSLHWYLKAAEVGSPSAQSIIGTTYLLGITVERDSEYAEMWLEKSARNGNPEAQLTLAKYYLTKAQSWKELYRVRRLLSTASKQNSSDALCLLGLLEELRIWKYGSCTEAVKCYEKAVKLGAKKVAPHLADCYCQGIGISKNERRAFQLYKDAAAEGDSYAMDKLRKLYHRNINGFDVDKKSFEEYKQQTLKGDTKAEIMLSLYYEIGCGCEKSGAQSIIYCQNAAMKGDPVAQRLMGVRSENGTGTPQDADVAMHWYELAAEQKDGEAQYRLAKLMAGTPSCDETQVVQLFTDSLMNGYDKGVGDLMSLYRMNPLFASIDYLQIMLLNEAFNFSAIAQCQLALLYEQGDGFAPSEEMALLWLRMASQCGNQEATLRLLQYQQKKEDERVNCAGFRGFWTIVKSRVREFYVPSMDGSFSKRVLSEKLKVLPKGMAEKAMGNAYKEGNVVEKSMPKAFSFYQKAAELGDASAKQIIKCWDDNEESDVEDEISTSDNIMTTLMESQTEHYSAAELCEMGDACSVSDAVGSTEEAFMWYTKAAEQNYAPALYKLAVLYMEKNDPAYDKQALDYLYKAATNDCVEAICELGKCYENGLLGLQKNLMFAEFWYRQGAMSNSTLAMLLLGQLYATGELENRTVKDALLWYVVAAQHGDDRGLTLAKPLGNVIFVPACEMLERVRVDYEKSLINEEEWERVNAFLSELLM